MLQLNNHTPFVAELSLLNDEQGEEALYVIVKATFQDEGRWTLASEPAPVWQEDAYYREPHDSSLRYPSDYHLGKLATDVLVQGEALAPEGKAVRQLPVSVGVGQLRRDLVVFGDRYWERGVVSQPDPFERMPLTFERAYGGVIERTEERVLLDERNPVGRFAAAREPEQEIEGELLPNIEDPAALIHGRLDRPEPAGLGAVAPHWAGRARHAGTYDEKWQSDRAPFAPDDFSLAHFNSAAPGMVYPGWLNGGEPICVSGMSTAGDWRCRLPSVDLSIRARVRGGDEPLAPSLETLMLWPNTRQLVMGWRARLKCPKKALAVESVSVALRRASH